MVSYIITHNTEGFEFLQSVIPIVLLIMLILMIADVVTEIKIHNELRQQKPKNEMSLT
ncbi:hypothetical protein HYW41_00505 [Candidatus Daviesbacteria bacterium]|nr:hypothetical protein [Candidatus Daviesbacteria bacterium]